MPTIRQVRSGLAGVQVSHIDVLSGDGVRVRVTSAGICGSDLHLLDMGPMPFVLGHEFGGRLDDGALVAVRPTVPCETCPRCRRGDQQLCRQVRTHLYGGSLDGGLADEVLVDERCLVRMADTVDPIAVGLVEPIAVAVHAANRVRTQPGGRALVIGGGTIGLACAAILIERGVQVDVSARHPAQRTAAAAIGAGTDLSRDYAVVIDAAGTNSSLDTAATAVSTGGQIVFVAMIWESVALPPFVIIKEVTVTPAMMYGAPGGRSEFGEAAAFLARHPELPGHLVTHRFSLDDAPRAFAVAADRASGAIKVHLIP